MSSTHGRGRTLGAAWLVGLVVLAAATQWLTAPLPSPLDPPLESWQAASLGPASPALRWAAPLEGTPFMRGLPPHAWVTAALPSPIHDGAEAWRVLGASLVAAFVAAFALALLAAGCHPLAAGAAAVTLPLAGVFRGDPFTSVESALAAVLVAGSLVAALRFRARGRWPWAFLSSALLALAVDARLSWLPLALPAWVVLDRPGEARRRRLALAAVCLAALLGASVHSLSAAWLTLASAPAGPAQVAASAAPADVVRLAALGPAAAGSLAGPRDQLRPLAVAAPSVFGLLGLGFVLVGLARFAARRAALVLPAALAAGALLVMAAASSPGQASFPMLALLLGGSLAFGFGADRVLRAPARRARVAAAVLVLLAPTLLAARFHHPEAWSADRSLAVSRDALAFALGPRPALVADLPPIDRAALPLAGLLRVPPDADTVGRFVAAGYSVHGFDRSRRELSARGLSLASLPLTCPSLEAYLAGIPGGSTVGIAATPDAQEALQYSPAAGARAIGGRQRTGAWLTRAVCLVGVAGASAGAVEAVEEGSAGLRVAANDVISNRRAIVPATLSLAAQPGRARVEAEGRWRVESRQGLALAVLDGYGNVWDARVVDETTGFLLAPPDGRLAAARVDSTPPRCVDVKGGTVTRLDDPTRQWAGLGWSVDGGNGGSLVLYALAHRSAALAPESVEDTRRLSVEPFAAGHPELARRMDDDGLSVLSGAPGGEVAAAITGVPTARVEVPLGGQAAWGTITLGAVPSRVYATFRETRGASGRLCVADVSPEVLFASPRQRAVDLGAGRGRDPRFGAGWYPREFDGETPFRWTGERAVLLLRLAPVSSLRVSVDATAAAEGTPATEVRLMVNGVAFPPRAVSGPMTTCEWVVDGPAWMAGLNEIELGVSRAVRVGADPRLLGIAVRGVRLERVE